MTTDRVEDLLSMYLAARASDRPCSVEELCRDCPDLAEELRQRIDVADRVDRLATPALSEQETGPLPPSDWRKEAGVPDRLGGYIFIRLLGKGGMGAVLLADDPALARQVAIKVMQPRLAADPVYRERFLQEARAAATLQHDHVVPIFHVGEEKGVPYLVMPLLEGESLESRLDRERVLTQEEVCRIGRETAEALAAAHGKGLIHRDIKPGNLWLEAPDGRVKVLDFGLARSIDQHHGLTRPGGVLGTPGYMAPEQMDGLELDGRADLFSLGAVLYRCATGTPAFTGTTLSAILRSVAGHRPPPPHSINPSVSAPLSALIMRLLEKSPASRPASARDLAEELARLDAPKEQPEPAPHSHRRYWVAGVSAALLALAIGSCVVLQPPQGPNPPSTPPPQGAATTPPGSTPSSSLAPTRGKLDVRLARNKDQPLLGLNEPDALPMRMMDTFRIEGEVDVPAYLYIVWVDPNHDVTPIYPWNPVKGWGTRPAVEQPIKRVSLPENPTERYRAPNSKSGVATMVMFARPAPLDVPDKTIRKLFENLPELPLGKRDEGAAIWFDNYLESKDPNRLRTFEIVQENDPFPLWQSALRKELVGTAVFQSAVSFARKNISLFGVRFPP